MFSCSDVLKSVSQPGLAGCDDARHVVVVASCTGSPGTAPPREQEVMQISCQPCPASLEPTWPRLCSDVWLFWDGYLLSAACLLQGHKCNVKRNHFSNVLKSKYFIWDYSNAMYRLLDILCFLPKVWDLGPFAGLDSHVVFSPGLCVPFSQGAEFLSVPIKW